MNKLKELFEDFATAVYETVNLLNALTLIPFYHREWEISKKIVQNRLDEID